MQTGAIAVLGLGYVGLPLALALSRAGFDVVGFDTDPKLIATLHDGRDPNGEVADQSVAARGQPAGHSVGRSCGL